MLEPFSKGKSDKHVRDSNPESIVKEIPTPKNASQKLAQKLGSSMSPLMHHTLKKNGQHLKNSGFAYASYISR